MQATGNKPPISVPAKGKYLFKDMHLSAAYFELPLKLPAAFPANTMTAQRILTVLAMEQQTAKQEQLAEVLFKFYWEEDTDISQLDNLKRALATCGFSNKEVDAIVLKANSPEAKKQLKDTTEEAVARGAFGAPTMFVHTADGTEHMIWGSDRFHILFPLIGVPWTGPNPPKGGAKL